MSHESIRELLRRTFDPDECRRIRELWIQHSLAEDARSIPGLLATLTEDCLYELPQSGHRWQGHAGAEQFYTQLLTAFPDVKFNLVDIVIGPQGVCEEAVFTATHQADWLDYPATGRQVTFNVIIFFPWDRQAGKFRGEKVYLDSYERLRGAAS